jgi:hypothetical protein
MGGADWVGHEYDGGMRWELVLARRLGCMRHRDGRRAAPTDRRETRAMASFLRVKAHGPMQLAASHLVRAEATVTWRMRGVAWSRTAEFFEELS